MTAAAPSLLLIEDEEKDAKLMTRRLEALGCDVQVVTTLSDARLAIADKSWTIAILDLRLPDGNGLELIPLLHLSRTTVVCVTGDEHPETVFKLNQIGCDNYVVKSRSYPDRVFAAVKTVVDARDFASSTKSNVVPIRRRNGSLRSSLLGDSEAMSDLRSQIENVARFDVPVLITGETGTGKELVAKAIHVNSTRAEEPFVAINCAAMTSELFESEVFGHEKGAFTSATKHEGLFVQASGGTLFLDEIGDLDLKAQAKLLRVLNDGTFRPVGAKAESRSNARIVSATNVDIKSAVSKGEFRADLAFRLEKIQLQTPSLREMISDIPILAEAIVSKFDEIFFSGSAPHTISEHALEELCAHTWPGNVRELENVIERRLIQNAEDPIMTFGLELGGDSQESRDARLKMLLRKHQGDTEAVARELSIDRRTVQRQAKTAGIDLKAYTS